MKPEEFISFDEKEPDKNKWIIVTNNLNALNAYGEMSHVWLTDFCTISSHGSFKGHRMAYDNGDRPVYFLTHWKYA